MIDDWLFEHGVFHEREAHYPDSNMRSDFKIGEWHIEYFGLGGQFDYDAKVARKLAFAQENGVKVISLTAKDLLSSQRLESLLQPALSKG